MFQIYHLCHTFLSRKIKFVDCNFQIQTSLIFPYVNFYSCKYSQYPCVFLLFYYRYPPPSIEPYRNASDSAHIVNFLFQLCHNISMCNITRFLEDNITECARIHILKKYSGCKYFAILQVVNDILCRLPSQQIVN